MPIGSKKAAMMPRGSKKAVSGKVLDGGPCTPFDPAPLGLALHEAQGEELVSTPVFITAGLNENKKN